MNNSGNRIKRNRQILCKAELSLGIQIIRRAVWVVLLLVSAIGFGQSRNSSFDLLYHQMEQKNFFKVREIFAGAKENLSKDYRYFTEAVLYNAFNKPEGSNRIIMQLQASKNKLPDSLMLKIWRLKEDNCMKQYDYAGAKKAIETALAQYNHLLKDEEKADFKNNLKIWTALENQPRQQVKLIGPTRLKMNIIPAGIDVDAIIGASVKADLAVCKKLTFGNVIVENAIFLVFADEALSFPQMNYQINGILGFPVIEALKEIQLTQDDYFMVPDKETKIKAPSNMAIDGLSPLIFIDGQHFTFDTGADHTMLYEPFYRENKKDIDQQYHLVKIGMGGAGGKTEHDGFKVNHTFHILGKEVSLKEVNLLKNKINKETVYGNIGQDVIRQFSKMTLNFDQMFIKFD
ncbi:hypothetical protein IQ37_16910 [Chryseobacterium piperi]|uniref:Peptidase A2 domain-containing protein n=1 Tax=Chryseobacterium piperi TaxID=558152 RepID=A0A086AMH4_9FLAO|nr:hypothetical protein [Chryseobacterium piperi]ASW73091.1 hypothetical protein CJF12_01505 [Chryseobacterium piperi]KFF17888.1 hypothetical protein IQ37_16910 [Chryseobacterium piperi]